MDWRTRPHTAPSGKCSQHLLKPPETLCSPGRNGERWFTTLGVVLHRALVVLPTVASVVLLAAWPASARHNFSMLEVATQQVAAGEEVAVSGFSYTETAYIRLDGLDGPVLTSLEPSDDDVISGIVRIPESAEPGRHVLYAIQQDEAGNPSRFPGKAALTVVEPGGPPLRPLPDTEPDVRPASLIVADPFSFADFLTIALATVGAMSLVTMVVYGFTSRRRRGLAPQPS